MLRSTFNPAKENVTQEFLWHLWHFPCLQWRSTDGLPRVYRWSTDSLLTVCWQATDVNRRSTEGLLSIYWGSTDDLLRVSWGSTDGLLTVYRQSTDSLLSVYWRCEMVRVGVAPRVRAAVLREGGGGEGGEVGLVGGHLRGGGFGGGAATDLAGVWGDLADGGDLTGGGKLADTASALAEADFGGVRVWIKRWGVVGLNDKVPRRHWRFAVPLVDVWGWN